jgi:FAD-dependent oxidoreductase family protein
MRYLFLAIMPLLTAAHVGAAEPVHDLVIYGGTSAGVAAAVQARKMGKSVVLIEPTNRLGGLTTGGLGQTDIGNKAAIGGLAREFYEDVRKHYSDPTAWKWQQGDQYMDSGQTRTSVGEDAMWTFEPSAALTIYDSWVKEHGVEVVYGERLDRDSGVATTRSIPWRIVGIRMESGRSFRGKMFIDATYEGDLMAAANVRYTVGREANSQYGETLSGVQTGQARYHQFVPGVDPYVEKGKPDSGLLPFLDPDGPGEEGTGDRRVQAYCFRMCLTDHPENRIPFHKPEGYDPQWYELLLRNFEAGEAGMPWINSSMPNCKTDTNNRTAFSTDFIGENYEYPEASYEEREKIVARHRLYQQGLMWTLANDPRVPDHIRNEVARWGMCGDEFTEGNGWQDQLYVREARRLVSDYVMTEHHCRGRDVAEDPVGLGAYGMDSHNTQRYVNAEGEVRNEGDVEVGGFSPYPISYRSIVPKAEECSNLLVPVCLSASHMAFGSIRMEPVFMVLGQSAATAATHAIEENVAVQEIDFGRLRERLLAEKQVLEWTGPKKSGVRAGIHPDKLKGIVVDDQETDRQGFAVEGRTVGPFVGAGYFHDSNRDKGHQTAQLSFTVEGSGRYEVRMSYPAHSNRAANVPVVVGHVGGEASIEVNQQKTPAIDKLFHSLGSYEFVAGEEYGVTISNSGTDGYVIVDAIQIVPVEE